MTNVNYAGFWLRFAASLIDTVLLLCVIVPILIGVYGTDYLMQQSAVTGVWNLLLNWVFPAVAVIIFWLFKSATPGKILFKLRIVDADTGEKPFFGRLLLRYVGYYISTVPLLLGFIWVGLDRRKQGWHDKLANTLVVKDD